jgi:hypothetical protein
MPLLAAIYSQRSYILGHVTAFFKVLSQRIWNIAVQQYQRVPFQQASHAWVLDGTDCYRKIFLNPYLAQP